MPNEEKYRKLLKRLDPSRVPNHVGIIMDGNRRWAKSKGLPVFEGHRRGKENTRSIENACVDAGVKTLTLYAFSSENLKKREEGEKKFLLSLFERAFKEYAKDKDVHKHRIRINVFGRTELLPENVRKAIETAKKATENYDSYYLNICLVYDGQDEIVDAVRKIVKEGVKPEQIDRQTIKKHLYTKDCPEADFIIRTGMNKEKRLSGFLLWDSSYSEFYFTPVFWPAFDKAEFIKALIDYQKRERRFGK